jgi:hypothetical protein
LAECISRSGGGVDNSTALCDAFDPSKPQFLTDHPLADQMLREWPDAASTVSRPRLVAGRPPEPGEQAIVLDRNVAAWHGIEVGQVVDVLTPDVQHPLTVVGLGVNSEFCPYPNCNPPRHFLAPGTMMHLGLLPSPVSGLETWMVGLRLQEPEKWLAALHAVEGRRPPRSTLSRATNWK